MHPVYEPLHVAKYLWIELIKWFSNCVHNGQRVQAAGQVYGTCRRRHQARPYSCCSNVLTDRPSSWCEKFVKLDFGAANAGHQPIGVVAFLQRQEEIEGHWSVRSAVKPFLLTFLVC